MKSLTIKVQWGSLGDHLLHSPLPRLAKEVYGYNEVFISNKSDYYNPQIKRFVWELNPYVDGFNDEDHEHPLFTALPSDMNILDAVAHFYGFEDDGFRFREPEVYYTPKHIPSLSNAIIFESNHHNPNGIPTMQQTESYFQNNGIRTTHDMAPLYQNPYVTNRPKVVADGLEDLCDVIHSCKRFYCYMSGVATLAAALGKSCTILYVDGIASRFRHSKLHRYEKIG